MYDIMSSFNEENNMTITTKDCKDFILANAEIIGSSKKDKWKRTRKYKRNNLVLRDFENQDGKTITIAENNGQLSIHESTGESVTPKVIGYYQFDPEKFSVALVTKEFWEENECLDDSGSEAQYVPKGFFELSEAIYEHDFDSHKEACKALKDAGWVPRKFLGDLA